MSSESIQFDEARLSDLAVVRHYLKRTSLKLGFEPDAVSEMVLAANEAVTNIIVHGYEGKPGCVRVTVCREGADLIVYIRDSSPYFDPNSYPPPDITLPLELRAPGGMGIHMMRNFVDDILYRHIADGVNELTLVKRNAVSVVSSETKA